MFVLFTADTMEYIENVGEREVGCQKLHDMKRKEEPDKELKQRIGRN